MVAEGVAAVGDAAVVAVAAAAAADVAARNWMYYCAWLNNAWGVRSSVLQQKDHRRHYCRRVDFDAAAVAVVVVDFDYCYYFPVDGAVRYSRDAAVDSFLYYHPDWMDKLGRQRGVDHRDCYYY